MSRRQRLAQHVITIDGPAGSGKTTVARDVAHHLGWLHANTGAMYRALAWSALQAGCDPTDARTLLTIARRMRMTLQMHPSGTLQVYLNGRNVSRWLQHPRVSGVVSPMASHPRIRRWMVQHQRRLARCGPLVMEGRDIGTVVFPQARWKFFMSASLAERARRRCAELRQQGQHVSVSQVLRDVRTRDHLDRHRSVGTLTRARDATVINTTHRSVEEVTQRILTIVRRTGP